MCVCAWGMTRDAFGYMVPVGKSPIEAPPGDVHSEAGVFLLLFSSSFLSTF